MKKYQKGGSPKKQAPGKKRTLGEPKLYSTDSRKEKKQKRKILQLKTRQSQLAKMRDDRNKSKKIKTYLQKGGFTPPPPGVIMRDEPKTIEGYNEMMEEQSRKAKEAQMRQAQERGRGLIGNSHPKTIEGYNEMIQEQSRKVSEAQRRQAQERGTGAILDRGNFPAKYKLGGNTYHAKMFRKSKKH